MITNLTPNKTDVVIVKLACNLQGGHNQNIADKDENSTGVQLQQGIDQALLAFFPNFPTTPSPNITTMVSSERPANLRISSR